MGRRRQRVRWGRRDDSWGHQAGEEEGREVRRTKEEVAGKTWIVVCSPTTLATRRRCIEENENNCHVPTGQNDLMDHTTEQI